MLIVLLLLVALLLFWAYVRWDARRMKSGDRPLDRAQLERGYKPRGIVKWHVYLGLAGVAGLLAFLEWQAPSHPAFTGRLSAVKLMAYEVLGPHGMLAIYLLLGGALLLAALMDFRRPKP